MCYKKNIEVYRSELSITKTTKNGLQTERRLDSNINHLFTSELYLQPIKVNVKTRSVFTLLLLHRSHFVVFVYNLEMSM